MHLKQIEASFKFEYFFYLLKKRVITAGIIVFYPTSIRTPMPVGMRRHFFEGGLPGKVNATRLTSLSTPQTPIKDRSGVGIQMQIGREVGRERG